MNANGAGPGLRAVQRRHARGRGRRRARPRDVRAQPATKSARVTWTPAEQRRRQRDHRPDGHPLRRLGGPDPGRPWARRRRARRSPGSTTARATRSASRRRTASAPSAASAAVERRDAAGHDLRLRHARRRSTPATTAASSSASSSAPASTGSVTGVRFYKAAANTGTHVGSLWTTGGTLLASATFTDERRRGWQSRRRSRPRSR